MGELILTQFCVKIMCGKIALTRPPKLVKWPPNFLFT